MLFLVVLLKLRRSSLRSVLSALTFVRYSMRFSVGEIPRGLRSSSSLIELAAFLGVGDLKGELIIVLYISFAC